MTQPSSQSTTSTDNETPTTVRAKRPQWQAELIWNGSAVLFSLWVLPLAVYFVGKQLLGDYGGGTIGAFYQRYFASLMSGSVAAWSLLIGPAIIVTAARYSLKLYRKPPLAPPPPETTEPLTVAQPNSSPRRREPFIGN